MLTAHEWLGRKLPQRQVDVVIDANQNRITLFSNTKEVRTLTPVQVEPTRQTDDTTVVCEQFLVYASKCITVTAFCSVFSYVTWISVDKTPSRCG